jgi:hypothetical protein
MLTVKKRITMRRVENPAKYPDPYVKESDTWIPHWSISLLFSVLILGGLAVAIYVVVMSAHERYLVSTIDALIYDVQDTEMVVGNNITEVQRIVDEVTRRLIIIEGEIDVLEQNLTYLGERIANLSCTGIFSVNGVDMTPEFNVSAGTPLIVEVQQAPGGRNELFVNGTRLLVLLEIQEGQLTLLQTTVASLNVQIAALDAVALKFLDGTPPTADNNVDFVGICNSSAYGAGNATVVIDACGIQALIEQQFQVIWQQFQVALGKIAMIQGNITIINGEILQTQNILGNLTSRALFYLNGRSPIQGRINVTSADNNPETSRIVITPGPGAGNELTMTNTGLLTINNLSSAPVTGNFVLGATDGLAVDTTAPDTVTFRNTLNSARCQISTTALSVLPGPLSGAAPTNPFLQQLLDVNFGGPGSIVSTPSNCNVNASTTFRRFGVADPFVRIVNQVCKPEGRWILSFQALISLSTVGGETPLVPPGLPTQNYLSLNIALGSEGFAYPAYPMGSWLQSVFSSFFVGASSTMSSTTTITSIPRACYNVTFVTPNIQDLLFVNILTAWTFTEI